MVDIGRRNAKAKRSKKEGHKNGAEDEIRTRDPLLGKEVLYH